MTMTNDASLKGKVRNLELYRSSCEEPYNG